jgi:hypothetical protein
MTDTALIPSPARRVAMRMCGVTMRCRRSIATPTVHAHH